MRTETKEGFETLFQPTPSARRVTCIEEIKPDTLFIISTHTLRKEGDLQYRFSTFVFQHFNPHPPQGG